MGRTTDPKRGDLVDIKFPDGHQEVGEVLEYQEDSLPGACDLTTECLMLRIPGHSKPQPLIRHSIFPEEQQEWCAEHMPGTPMLTLAFRETYYLKPTDVLALVQ